MNIELSTGVAGICFLSDRGQSSVVSVCVRVQCSSTVAVKWHYLTERRFHEMITLRMNFSDISIALTILQIFL